MNKRSNEHRKFITNVVKYYINVLTGRVFVCNTCVKIEDTMIKQVSYDIITADGPLHITITPVNEPIPGGNYFATGIFRLTAGVVGMGEITFDENMQEWNYDGLGDLTYDEAEEIADSIKDYKDPDGADPSLLY